MTKLGRFIRRKWTRRFMRGFGILLVVLVVGGLITRYVIRYRGQQKLDEQVAALDASDPRWRWEDIEADRPAFTDAENSALVVAKVIEARGGNADFPVKDAKSPNPSIDQAPNRFQSPEEAEAVNEALKGQDAALAIARTLRNYPRGRHSLTLLPDSPMPETPHLKPARTVATLLEFDMERLAVADRPDEALAQVQSMLFLARSFDGEPSLLSQIIRCVMVGRAMRSVERTLAMGVPKGDLASLQKLLRDESEVDRFTAGIRGERAAMHRLCERFANGEASIANWSVAVNAAAGIAGSPDIFSRISAWITAGTFLPINHAKWLEYTTRTAEATKLPEDEQLASLPNVRAAFDPEIVLSRMHIPAMQKLLATHLRLRAHLRCASAALAVERYRILNGNWPNSLADVSKQLLSEIPFDPFVDKPLKFKLRPDGVSIYSVGLDKVEDTTRLREERSTFGEDVVFRLYNPDQRRLPAVPKLD